MRSISSQSNAVGRPLSSPASICRHQNPVNTNIIVEWIDCEYIFSNKLAGLMPCLGGFRVLSEISSAVSAQRFAAILLEGPV